MERTVLKHAPDYWNKNIYEDLSTQFSLDTLSQEYRVIEYQIKKATRNNNIKIKLIQRNQNIHDYGQVLIRGQLMAVANSLETFYRVRRYIVIKKQYLANALDYNLDHRRCGKAELVFTKQIITPDFTEVILVVQVITNTPDADTIRPKNSSDYFIDYIINL